MSEADEKRELLRLKQGLIKESELIKEEKPSMPELHGKKKVENFFYHYKVHVLLITFLSIAAVFMTIDIATKEKADVKIIVCTNQSEEKRAVYLMSDAIEDVFGELCFDYDGNGYASAEVQILDVTQDEYTDPNVFVANSTRLFGEMQSGSGQLLIGNLDMYYSVLGDASSDGNDGTSGTELDFLLDLTEIYGDSPYIIDRYFIKVKDSVPAKMAEWEDCPEDLYYAVRKASEYGSRREQEKNLAFQTRALDLLDRIVEW